MDMNNLLAQIPFLPESPTQRAAVIFAGAVLVAFIARFAFRHLVHRLAKTTDTDVDDQIAEILRGPIFWSFVFGGFWLAEIPLALHDTLDRSIKGVMLTLIIIMWSFALLRSSKVVLDALSRNVDRFRWIQPKTVPLLDMVAKFLVAGAGVYLICVAWEYPPDLVARLRGHHGNRRRFCGQGYAGQSLLRRLHPRGCTVQGG